jgi:hypothetical protein
MISRDARVTNRRTRPIKATTNYKIRFTEPQIELVIRAHPNCNLDHLTELSFKFEVRRHDQGRRKYGSQLCRNRARALVWDSAPSIFGSANHGNDIALS